MSQHLFLDISPSNADENAYPTQIAWSLDDGRVKTVLIQPDDSWEPWENADYNTDVQLLMDQGETPGDIISELNNDLDGETVYVDGLVADGELLDRLFDACDQTPTFEIDPIKELYNSLDSETLYEYQREIIESYSLDYHECEDKVKGLLYLNQQLSNGDL